ncbi:Glucooligosaccharide oxidase [Xylaria cf. heliscus]|nr:Glucooligosaccharide oxidase [Xylaria cf. heliscus]
MDISSTLESLGIEIKTPLKPLWNLYSGTYNTRVPALPRIVILPATIEQVSQAVCCCAATCGLKVQARSGGHSYASHSNGGVDGSAVIDLRKLQNICSCGDGIVRVGGGVRLGNLAKTIFTRDEMALAHGTCPTVGIGGHFTHGGFGMQSRAWGLAMDQIVALDVVMADGRVVKASEFENRDIFAAMRGAADSFGIIVNFYLRTQRAPGAVVKWSVHIPEAMKSVKNAVEAFQLVQDFANNPSIVDRRLGLVVFLKHDCFTLEGTYLGNMNEFSSTVLSELLRWFRYKRGIEVRSRQFDWLNLLRAVAGDTDLEVDPDTVERQCFFAKSAAVALPGLSRDALEEYFKYLLDNGARVPIDYFVGAQLYGGADSQITANPADDSYEHRNAMWMFQHYGSAQDGFGFTEIPEEGIRFVEGLNEALGHGHGASNNYADPSLERDEALQLYYGSKLQGLMELKGVLDPNDVFSHPQSIPPKTKT